MLGRAGLRSLFFSLALGRVAGLELDVNSQNSIKSVAKTLAGGIVSFYNDSLKKDLIPGLFPDPYYWWEAGAVFHGLIEYAYLTGDSQYDSLVSEGLQWQLGDYDAFMPLNQTKVLGNDDQSTWGLAAMTAAEVGFPKPKNGDWLDYAANVFNTQVQRLQAEEKEGTCKGGLRWQIFSFNNGYDYKNAASNGNFFLLAARLAKLTGNSTYTQWAEKSFTWATDIGLVSGDYAVFDGADARDKCKTISQSQWTSNHGIYTEGAALMFNITNGAQNWTDTVKGFVKMSSTFEENGIFVETACEDNGICDIDQKAFKGMAVRSLARAAISAPFVADSINKVLQASAKGAASACSGSGADVSCKLSWANPDSKESATAKDGNLSKVFSALEAVQALLYPQAKALATGSGNRQGTGSGSGNANATQSGGASKSSGTASPQSAGSAGTIAASVTAVVAVAFAAVLSC